MKMMLAIRYPLNPRAEGSGAGGEGRPDLVGDGPHLIPPFRGPFVIPIFHRLTREKGVNRAPVHGHSASTRTRMKDTQFSWGPLLHSKIHSLAASFGKLLHTASARDRNSTPVSLVSRRLSMVMSGGLGTPPLAGFEAPAANLRTARMSAGSCPRQLASCRATSTRDTPAGPPMLYTPATSFSACSIPSAAGGAAGTLAAATARGSSAGTSVVCKVLPDEMRRNNASTVAHTSSTCTTDRISSAKKSVGVPDASRSSQNWKKDCLRHSPGVEPPTMRDERRDT
eukprot:scaffold2014_cov112-Isochrysis_galbana.AAC.7